MQVNLSLTPETKDCLTELQSKMHCTSLSDVITRLAWDASHRYEIEYSERCSKSNDKSSNAFTMLVLMAFANTMIRRFESSFRNDYVYNFHEFKKLAEKGSLSDDIINQAFIYTLSSTKNFPAYSIVRYNEYIHEADIVGKFGSAGEFNIDYWNVDDICGLKRGEIVIKVITKRLDWPDKLGEQPLQSSGLCNLTAAGFEIKHKSGNSIICKWNEISGKFDISLNIDSNIINF